MGAENDENSEFNAPPGNLKKSIDLESITFLIANRKLFVLSIIALFFFLGLGFYFLSPDKTEYSTLIEIGQTAIKGPEGMVTSPIESTQSVVIKLRQKYIPMLTDKMLKNSDVDTVAPRVEVRPIKGSNLVKLYCRISRAHSNQCVNLLENIGAALVNEHDSKIGGIRRFHELEVERERLELERLTDPSIFSIESGPLRRQRANVLSRLRWIEDEEQAITSLLRKLETEQNLLKRQIDEVNDLLNSTLKKRDFFSQDKEQSISVKELYIDSEIQRIKTQLTDLKKELNQGIPNKRLSLERERNRLRRDKEEYKSASEQIKLALDELEKRREQDRNLQEFVLKELELESSKTRNTKVVSLPVKSPTPDNPGIISVVLLSLTIGFLVALIAVFLIELIRKVTFSKSPHLHR